jgi:hypothetical protein
VIAWWCSLYVGYISKVRLGALPYFSAVAVLLSLIDYLLALDLLQTNSSSNPVGHAYLTFVVLVLFGSPILLNEIVWFIKGAYENRRVGPSINH